MNKNWAIVELFGHARIAGEVSEETVAGEAMLRVDVPDVPRDQSLEREAIAAHTRYFGGKAIYSINPVDEVAARVAAATIRHRPISTYSLADVFSAMTEDDRVRLLGESARNRPALPDRSAT